MTALQTYAHAAASEKLCLFRPDYLGQLETGICTHLHIRHQFNHTVSWMQGLGPSF